MKRMHTVSHFTFIYALIPLAVTYEPLASDCTVWNTALTCQQSIPRELPGATQEVYITDYKDKHVGRGRFAHSSWRSVKQFDINANIDISLEIDDYVFTGLDNITTLGIHGRKGNAISEKAFVGIDRARKLDLSNRIDLDSETLIKPLLYNSVLPNLRSLILENVNTERGNSNFKVSRSFFHMLRTKKIRELSVRGTNLIIEGNVNNISTLVKVLDVSNASFSYTRGFRWGVTFPNLISLNMSSPVARYLTNVTVNKHFEYCNDKTSLPRMVKMFYANFFFLGKEMYINNLTVNITAQCIPTIKIIHIRGNSIHFFNATIHLPANFSLYELDMSSNNMKFLSAAVLKDMVNLKNLYLGDNLLSSMSNHPDFEILFKPLHRLRRLSLAYNSISYIPEQMFLHNLNLEWLDLEGNYLKSTSFIHLHLKYLKFLNISDNRIAYLAVEDFIKLEMVIKRNGNKVKITGNPFECTCDSVDFLEWINENFVNGTRQYLCNYEKEMVSINAESIAKAKFLCIRTAVYIISSVISVVVASGLLITILLAFRYFSNKRRATELNKFKRNFRNGRWREKYLCMLSYSDNDADISNKLYNHLEALLKDNTKCERDVVCINDKHFRAGTPIVDEIIRCMSESLVSVFVVSEAFCRSNWCCLEVREAYEQQKPIILIFVEDVSEENMSLHLRNVFKRYTRGKLFKTEDGKVDFQPGGLQGLCDSIILLASGEGRNLRNGQDAYI